MRRPLIAAAITGAIGLIFVIEDAIAACTISSTNIAFGSVNLLPGTAVDTTGTMTLNCTGGAPPNRVWRNCVSIGAGSAGDATSRILTSGANSLRYNLYADAAHTIVWGSWQTGYATAGQTIDVGYNSSLNVTVFARILASQQTTPIGIYTSAFPIDPHTRHQYNTSTACPTGGNNANTLFTVTATVVSGCTVSATTLNFGTVGVLNANIDTTGSVSVQCTNGTPYTVALNGGLTGAIDPTQRKMVAGAQQITYGIYRNAARTQPWGSTTGIDTVSGTGDGSAQPITTYGRVPAQITLPPATYSDTVVVTVTY